MVDDENIVYQRLRDFLIEKKKDPGIKTKRELGKILGVSEQFMGKVINGTKPPTKKMLALAPQIWPELNQILRNETNDLVLKRAKAIEREQTRQETTRPLTIGDLKRHVGPNRDVNVFEVLGSSMSPTLRDGDLVFCVKGDFRENYIHVIKSSKDGWLIKRLKREDRGYFVAMSDNPETSTFIIEDDNPEIWLAKAKLTFDLSGTKGKGNDISSIENRLSELEKLIK